MMNNFKPTRHPLIAAILSAVLPGVGQIYAGQWKRGLALFIGIPAQIALFYGADKPDAHIALLIPWLAIVWLWNIWDAVQLAKGFPTSVTIPAVVIIALNLIAAANITKVQIPDLDGNKRVVVRRIGAGLAKPDLVTPNSSSQEATAKFVIPGPGIRTYTPMDPAKPGDPSVLVSPVLAHKDQTIKVRGAHCFPNTDGEINVLIGSETKLADFHTDAAGRFEVSFVNKWTEPGQYFVRARLIKYEPGWQISGTLRDAAPKMVETIYLALIGTGLSLLFALPLSFFGARNLMSGAKPLKAFYGITRGLFSILRSVEVLVIVMVAAVVVGFGPFAGVLALAIHGIGALGKLYSEAIESIEHGPIEAIRATGANELQVVLYGVVPQVVPQFIAFTLYRWDINVRMATVIGLVGGGGIGATLMNYINLLQWRQAAAALWLIIGVVLLMDYASAIVREKIV